MTETRRRLASASPPLRGLKRTPKTVIELDSQTTNSGFARDRVRFTRLDGGSTVELDWVGGRTGLTCVFDDSNQVVRGYVCFKLGEVRESLRWRIYSQGKITWGEVG